MLFVMMSTINHTYNRSAAAKQDRWSECFTCRGNSFSGEDDIA